MQVEIVGTSEDLLKQLADRNGQVPTAILRLLIHQEAKREGIWPQIVQESNDKAHSLETETE